MKNISRQNCHANKNQHKLIKITEKKRKEKVGIGC